jgi:hypothetical protein
LISINLVAILTKAATVVAVVVGELLVELARKEFLGRHQALHGLAVQVAKQLH